jgi:hypothetical protein
MALPTSGPLSIQQINAEFGRGNNLNAYRGTVWYTDAGGSGTFSSGAISISDFYGKRATSPTFTATIYSHYDQLNLRSWALSAGWNGSSAAIITLAGGYYLYSSNVGAAALYINGSWPGGLTFVNNGYIMGCGGHGGGYRVFDVTSYASNIELQNGGPAISMGVSCTIQNNAYIGGGGGGGGGVLFQSSALAYGRAGICGGGGAGGGQGGSAYNGAAPGTLVAAGGAGGGIGGGGANGIAGAVLYQGDASGGGGGRIMPGARTGSPNAVINGGNAFGGYGGEGGVAGANQYIASTGSTASGSSIIPGYGGQAGGSGAALTGQFTYNNQTGAGGGGGGWGSSGGTARAIAYGNTTAGSSGDVYGGGAAGGYCVYLNGNSITWSATGTRWGAIG